MATMMVGITATNPNNKTSRTWSRDPMRPRRRSAQTCTTRQKMMPQSGITRTRFSSKNI